MKIILSFFPDSKLMKLGVIWGILLGAVSVMAISGGGVTADGSLGTLVNNVGGVFSITGGTTQGNNLFHSFSEFNVETGETVDLIGNMTLANIFIRVSGANNSYIDGQIKTTNTNANVWFMNPNGEIFSANSSLDIQGSLFGQAADYIEFADGNKFYADPLQGSVLTAALPESVGFLAVPTGVLTVTGSTLTVQENKTISFIAGNIQVDTGALLRAQSGRINLISVKSAGEVNLSGGEPNTNAITTFGDISINNVSEINVSGNGAGSVYIQAAQLNVLLSTVQAYTQGVLDGEEVKIIAENMLLNGSDIDLQSNDDGQAPGLTVEVQDDLDLFNGSSISCTTNDDGDGSLMTIEATNLEMTVASSILNQSFGPNIPGGIILTVPWDLKILGNSQIVGENTSAIVAGVISGQSSILVGPLSLVQCNWLQPGDSPGTFTFSSFDAASFATGKMTFELDGLTPGVEYDQVILNGDGTGDFDLAGAELELVLGAAPGLFSQYTIINNISGEILNTPFNGLPEGSIVYGTFNSTPYGFTISYVGGDGDDVVLSRGAGIKTTHGAVFPLGGDEVNAGLVFTRKPMVNVTYLDGNGRLRKIRQRVYTRVSKANPKTLLQCEWHRLVSGMKLYDIAAFRTAYRNGTAADVFLAANPILDRLCNVAVRTVENGVIYDLNVGKSLQLTSPQISGVFETDGTTPAAVAGAGDQIILKGLFFGSARPPKIWLEYLDRNGRTRKKFCRIVRDGYIYQRVNGRPAAMDFSSCGSEVMVRMPIRWPRAWNHGAAHNLVIDNGVGIDTVAFATQP